MAVIALWIHQYRLAQPSTDVAQAGGGQVVGAAGQGGREPPQLAALGSGDLHVHAVVPVFVGVVGAAVAGPVALGEGAVGQPAETDGACSAGRPHE